jgi:4'-phosphopantetheinyl transferase
LFFGNVQPGSGAVEPKTGVFDPLFDFSSPDRPARVHVWAAHLDLEPEGLAVLSATLSATERQRAARFRLERHRNRFIAGRGFLRLVLSRYLQVEPAGVRFDYGPHGKPELAGRLAGSGLHFNLAHSEEIALLAVTRAGPVGVDVERVRPLAEAAALVARFFSPREGTAYRNLPADQQREAFFNLWTRKEAWLKATGEGIAHSLHQVEVSFLPGEPARLLRVPAGRVPEGCWSLHHLEPAPGFVGAVAIGADQAQLGCRRWDMGGQVSDAQHNAPPRSTRVRNFPDRHFR